MYVLIFGYKYKWCFRINMLFFRRTSLDYVYIEKILTKNTHMWSWILREILARKVLKNESLYFFDYKTPTKPSSNL
jgi:hypothetical protein